MFTLKRIAYILAFSSAVSCGGGAADGPRPVAKSDIGDPGRVPHSNARRVFSTTVAGADCGAVPRNGRCLDAQTLEACLVPEALAKGHPVLIYRTTCDPGERCVAMQNGARCAPELECINGETRCADSTTLKTCVGGKWQTSSCSVCKAGADLGASCAAAAPGFGNVVARGRLTYEYLKRRVDLTGLQAMPTVDGAVRLLVRVYDGILIGEGETFESSNGRQAGEFEVLLTREASAKASIHFYAIDRSPLGAPRLGVAVAEDPEPGHQQSGAYFSWRTDLCRTPEACSSDSIDVGDVLINDASESGAIHIFQWLNFGMGQLRSLYPDVQQPSLVAFWRRDQKSDCGACFLGHGFGGAKVFAGGPHIDAYDTSMALSGTPAHHYLPSVVTHELGHFVMSAYSKSSNEGDQHFLDSLSSPGLAWSEGWATFFGQTLLSRDLLNPDPIHFSVDTDSGNAFWGDLNRREKGDANSITPLPTPNPTGPVDQPVNEAMVASVLWSLWARGQAQDPQGLGDQPIFQAFNSPRMREFNRGYAAPDLIDFLDALGCSELTLPLAITEVVAGAGYPWHSGDHVCAP